MSEGSEGFEPEQWPVLRFEAYGFCESEKLFEVNEVEEKDAVRVGTEEAVGLTKEGLELGDVFFYIVLVFDVVHSGVGDD